MRDLSHPLSEETPVYPGDPPVEIRAHATHEEDGYRVIDLRLGSHAGTHIDAPAHTEPEGKPISAYPVDRFAFAARIIDCTDCTAGGRISVDVIPNDPDCDLLVFQTGWDAHWDTPQYREHPVLTPAAAAQCADMGCDVGLDTASPDPFGSTELPAHHELLGADQFILENLCNLAGLPDRVRLHAYPLAINDADGAPVRVVAEWG